MDCINDTFLQTQGGLVDHGVDEPVYDLVVSEGFLPTQMGSQKFVHLRVRLAIARAVPNVESFPRFFPQPSSLDHGTEDRGRRHTVAETFQHALPGVDDDVDAHLVQEDEDPHRHPEIEECPVYLPDVRSLLQQQAGLVEVRKQKAVYQETRAILYDDRYFAQFPRESSHAFGRFHRGLSTPDHLDQGHPVHWVEEVETGNALRQRDICGHLSHRKGGGVSEDGGPRGHVLHHRGENRFFYIHALGHRFYDHV